MPAAAIDERPIPLSALRNIGKAMLADFSLLGVATVAELAPRELGDGGDAQQAEVGQHGLADVAQGRERDGPFVYGGGGHGQPPTALQISTRQPFRSRT